MTTNLPEIERDALQEVMNIAMGQAADALAQLAGIQVRLTIPKIHFIGEGKVNSIVGQGESLVSIRQSFMGDISGELLTLLSTKELDILAYALQYDVPLSDQERSELLLDVANMLNSACLVGVIRQLELRANASIPSIISLDVERFLEHWRSAFLLEIDFAIDEFEFEARVFIGVDEASFHKILTAVKVLLGEL